MLGEKHSLLDDFPELENRINALIEADSTFAADNKKYNALDKEIRTLELNNGPIGDDAMHQLKHQRSVMKDSLYQRIAAGE
ncbi:YdcH family protein [Enterovibrio makurazakiensis]|uniref:YdcH family protein n=1 Tax=Enterovibrio gelatinilyticus TaxID=2899819 RepID=A0ABT5R538_9GAMM|nr:YdcH family protein [Enterovibrio sp. ZSDZ42]MDD1795388.1 YdcH family protein [Enterovibrio sp. ZSDZ42]